MASPVADPTAPVLLTGDGLRRRELAAFLRSRRERIAPEQVGVPLTGRRRTPGLRREEVAQLSGVGVTWYTWLEQGRDINASDQVLGALARTLMLTAAERAHLFRLAGVGAGAPVAECNAVDEAQRVVLRRLDPFPACVQSGTYDLLDYNRAYNQLFGDLDALPVEDRNAMWLMFTDPAWRTLMVDWDQHAARMTANLRALMADHVGDASWKAHVARLSAASPEFTALWERHDVQGVENKRKRLQHARAGELRFDTTITWLGPRPGHRMLVYVPADDVTDAAVRGLVEED